MLSRRSVRVKAMQILYQLNRDTELTSKDAVRKYRESIDQSFNLLVYNIYLVYHICKVSVEDDKKRKSKFVPTEFDRAFSPKLFDNPLVKSIGTNRKLNALFNTHGFEQRVDKDVIQNIYFDYAKEPGYLAFLKSDFSHEATLEVLLDLFRFVKKYEMYEELLEDSFSNWVDDESVVIGAMKKIIKSLPTKDEQFFMEHFPDDETIKDFGEALLKATLDHNQELEDKIYPTFENWDSERIAIIDMIFLKLALAEFLYFETIPIKVTINEYVELSKEYSTPKSKEFVNGVLERLRSDLIESDKLNKTGRGLDE